DAMPENERKRFVDDRDGVLRDAKGEGKGGAGNAGQGAKLPTKAAAPKMDPAAEARREKGDKPLPGGLMPPGVAPRPAPTGKVANKGQMEKDKDIAGAGPGRLRLAGADQKKQDGFGRGMAAQPLAPQLGGYRAEAAALKPADALQANVFNRA